MALAKKCDRCGKLYNEYIIGNRSGEYNGLRLCRIDSAGNILYEKARMDLCQECMSQFTHFIEGGDIDAEA